MDTRIVILLVASLLVIWLVYFLVSIVAARRARRVASMRVSAEPEMVEDAPPTSQVPAAPVDLGGWVPPPSRRDYQVRAEIPVDELEARLAELSAASEAVVELASRPVAEPAPVAAQPHGAAAPLKVAAAFEPPSPPPVWQPVASAEVLVPVVDATAGAATVPAPATFSGLPVHAPAPPVDLASVSYEASAVVVPVESPAPAPSATPAPAQVAPEYRMVAPVELVFLDGGKRVGTRPGTATFLRYQRFAAVLLDDLKNARGL